MRPLIAFDLDGTLVDSRQDLAESANELVGLYGGAHLDIDAVTRMVGGGAKLLVERALKAAGVDPSTPGALEMFLEIYDRRLVRTTRVYAGVEEAVRDLAGRAYLAVLTNKPEGLSVKLLARLGLLDAFDEVVGGDGRFPRKPDPSGLRYLMARAGAEASSTWLVGDSVIDVETSRLAPARMCLVRYGFGPFPGPGELPAGASVVDAPANLQGQLRQFLEEN